VEEMIARIASGAHGVVTRAGRREREARARGDEFRRYTYGEVFEVPHEMLTELRTLLAGHDPALVSQDDTNPGLPG
jgi:hypothetical protein